MPTAPPPASGKRYLSLVCALSRPLSRGSVHIAAADPHAPPRIDPDYFGNAADLELLVRVLQYALKVYGTEPLSAVVRAPVMPSRETIERGREGLVEYIKENCRQVFHPVGTAAMMPREDGGVVDAELRVYGTSNLRIVSVLRLSHTSCSCVSSLGGPIRLAYGNKFSSWPLIEACTDMTCRSLRATLSLWRTLLGRRYDFSRSITCIGVEADFVVGGGYTESRSRARPSTVRRRRML